MNDFNTRLIQLLHYPNITWNTVFRILKKDPELKTIYHLRPQDLKENRAFPHLNSFEIPQFSSYKELIHEQIRQYQTNQIHVISIFDPKYPRLLKEIYQPPWALFAKGDLTLLQKEPKLAVVGSRQATPYGKRAIRLLLPRLIENDITIVSGLAKGIDALAHECAIENGGKTVAVIAGGLYHIYPRDNMRLALQMMQNQLVISEYPPDTKPERWHFPIRNRIISGLSAGTLLIEAKQKSGSLITANYAVNEGREVFSLPGSIFSPFSNGTNELIQQGAKPVLKPEDILEEIQHFRY